MNTNYGMSLCYFLAPAALFLLLMACSNNSTGPAQSAPKIDSIAVAPDFILPGGTLQLAASAVDPDGDPLQFQWLTYPRVGQFESDTLPNTSFTFASYLRSGMSVRFTLTVFDGKDSSSYDRWVTIDTGKSVTGHVYFSGTKVPVPSTGMKFGNRADTTDSDGIYQFFDLYTGQYTLEASREGFIAYSENIDLNENINKDVYLNSPTYSGVVSGFVRTKEGTPLENVKVILLNPDGTNSQIVAETDPSGFYSMPQVPTGNRRLLIEDGGNDDYDILVEIHDITLFAPGLNYDIVAKIRRIAFESDGAQSASLWETENNGIFDTWSVDTQNNCLRFDFCTVEDFGRLAMKTAVPVPSSAGAVYWIFNIELTEAACEVVVYVDGILTAGGIYWSGNKHYTINEPIRVPDGYQAGHNILLEIYAWPQRTGTCGSVRLNYFRLDYLE